MNESPLLAELRGVLSKLLDIADPNEIGVDDELELLGLDSLRAAQLGSELQARFGLDIESIYDCQAVKDLMVQIDTHEKSQDADRDLLPKASTSKAIHLNAVLPTASLPLAIDDLVPNRMLLLLGFDYDILPRLEPSLRRGLKVFPHLAGRIYGSLSPFDLRIKSSEEGIRICYEDQKQMSLGNLRGLPRKTLISNFFGGVAEDEARSEDWLNQPLLDVHAARLEEGASLAAIAVSHAIVDGAGLASFLSHCLAGSKERLNGEQTLPLHARQTLDPLVTSTEQSDSLPPWYVRNSCRESGVREYELARLWPVITFGVSDAQLSSVDRKSSTWFRLTAVLCRVLSNLYDFSEAAFWCDVRGTLGIPRNYTGNVGCYWHEKIGDNNEPTSAMAYRLQAALTHSASERIARVYQSVKTLQARGNDVTWIGTQAGVLPVNLVPYSAAAVDFGEGGAKFVAMLTRNVHGLRVTRSPQNDGFEFEICLPEISTQDIERECLNHGIRVHVVRRDH